jgi:signal transduction histidine kinase
VAARSRRSYLAGLVERGRFAERSREDEAARRVAEERLRIARDLHDSVAHAMATINVQAAAAAHVVARQPAAAGTALTAIQQASAEVLDELGSMLAVLRDDTEQAEQAPAPGVRDIRRLADSAGPSGLAVELCLDEPPPAVAPALGTAAYRVVQESLTNVLRHSLARSVRVRVGTVPDGTGPDGTGPDGTGPDGTGPDGTGPAGGLLVEVSDPGPARPDGTAGTRVGIRGMRERVTATGGQFAAGSTAGGGFAVRAQWRGSR